MSLDAQPSILHASPLAQPADEVDTEATEVACDFGGRAAHDGNAHPSTAPPFGLRALCHSLRLSPQRTASWAANGPCPTLRFYLFFPLSAAQCALAVAMFGIAAPWSKNLLVVRVVPGWVHIAARVTTILWPLFEGPGRTPLSATAAAELSYAAVGVMACLQPRACVPFRSRLVFSVLHGITVFCGSSALLVERPRDAKLGVSPALWALGVRTSRVVDVFTKMTFAGLMFEDVRFLPLCPA